MMQNTSSKLTCLLVALLSALGVVQVQAQSTAVTTSQSGSKVFLEINAQRLRSELDSLMIGLSSYGAGDWNAILTNGTNPGMDVNFSGYDAIGLEDVVASGTLSADSLVLNKDASITGRLTISGVTTVNDSLKATGYVSFSDSLEVVRAVSIGESLLVTGVTSLGDSLHVVGNVDLDAMLNVSGEVTLGSSLVVTGVTTMNDSLNVNGNAEITGTLGLDSLSVTDVINGQVNSLGNFTSDALMEGDSNLYFSAAERTLLASLSGVLNTLDSLIAVIDGLGGASESAFTCDSPVTYQGYDYATVEIGTQCWFAENLRSTNYNDDAVIPSELDASAWSTTTDGAMTIYDEGGADEATNLADYGRLYNWYAVNTGKLCPTGWHVPTDAEWTVLADYLDGESVAGDKMKSSASDSPAWDGTNSSGFSGLPGGNRNSNGAFTNGASNCYLWSSSPYDLNAWGRVLYSSYDLAQRTDYGRGDGFSVRCVQDAASSASVPTVVTDPVTVAELSGAILNGTVESDGGDAVTATGFRWGAQADLSDAADLAGDGTSGAFTALLSGLSASTTYYFTAFATNAEGTAYGDTLSFETASPSPSFSTCGDDLTYQGYDYATVQIGSQCWFAENLRSTNYNDESVIPSGLNNAAWTTTTDGAMTVYDEGGADEASNLANYGRLYNWYAVNTGKLCPSGWHVPTSEEWMTLLNSLGGNAGDAMKSSASDNPAWNGSNSSGFSGLPGGVRYYADGNFYTSGVNGYWWSSTPQGSTSALYYQLRNNNQSLQFGSQYLQNGKSVRCLKDAASSASVPTVVTDPVTVAELSGAILNGTVESDGGDAVTATGFRWGAQADLSDAADLAGDGTSGAFTAVLSGLTASTTYYFTAFATNAEGTAYGDTLSFETASPTPSFSTCGDDLTYQGHDYSTVDMFGQCWFAENLRTTQYADGTTIPEVTDNTAWSGLTSGARVAYQNSSEKLSVYGYLYNWHAVNDPAGLCPSGWHVPTRSEWTDLNNNFITYPHGTAGDALKAQPPSWDGHGYEGFSMLPGGYRTASGVFGMGASQGVWWSATTLGAASAYSRTLSSGTGVAFIESNNGQVQGNSVRCLKDYYPD